ncbi:MAG TPA: cupredoxin family copper-binding protein [Chthoniobacterales bacterium]|nr:cupredoxin family copper-binding protein [Chthoniobacterales bacterium]
MTTFIRKNMKAIILTALLVLNVCVAAFGDDAAANPTATNKNVIEIKDFMFNPMTITVKSGETVTWINRDDEPHTVVSVGKKFQKSSALDTDQKFTVTVGAPGTYEYFCSVHPKMTGKIVVEQ